MNKLPLKAYIWDIKTFKNSIVQDKLTSKDQLIYFFLFSFISMLLTSFPTAYSFHFSFWERMQDFVSLSIFCIAVIIAYRYNGGSKGKDFVFSGRDFAPGLFAKLPAGICKVFGKMIKLRNSYEKTNKIDEPDSSIRGARRDMQLQF